MGTRSRNPDDCRFRLRVAPERRAATVLRLLVKILSSPSNCQYHQRPPTDPSPSTNSPKNRNNN